MDVFKELNAKQILKKQIKHHSNPNKKNYTVKRKNVRVKDISFIRKKFPNAKSVLCIGSREDSEVQDFIDNGFSAIGTDILKASKLVREIDAHDIDKYFGENEFDVVFASHVLEHVSDVKKVMKNIKYISKDGVFIILPIVPRHKLKWQHPTIFEIMKLPIIKQTKSIFKEPHLYKNIWDDFNTLKPFELLGGEFRKGLTDPTEVYICLEFKNLV